jgi:hypothetical protein
MIKALIAGAAIESKYGDTKLLDKPLSSITDLRWPRLTKDTLPGSNSSDKVSSSPFPIAGSMLKLLERFPDFRYSSFLEDAIKWSIIFS